MDFIDSKVSDRLGGSSFFKSNDNLYKFEKIKKINKTRNLIILFLHKNIFKITTLPFSKM